MNTAALPTKRIGKKAMRLDLKILPKILLLLGLLAVVALAGTVFSTRQMRLIDDTYGDLIDGRGRPISGSLAPIAISFTSIARFIA